MTTFWLGPSAYYRFWYRKKLYERGGFPTKRAAKAAEWAKRAELGALESRRGSPSSRQTDVRLADYAETWLRDIALSIAPATLANYAERLRNHVLPSLGMLKIPDITPSHIKQLLTDKRKSGYAKNGVRLIKAALSALLSDAVEDGIITTNPAMQLGRSRRRRRAETLTPAERLQRIQPMTLAQRAVFLATAWTEAPKYAPLFETLVKTGIRPSEAFGLQLADADLDAGILRIERAWVLGQLKSTKTCETRTVDLTLGLVAILRQQVAAVQTEAQYRGWAEPLWMFPSEHGKPLDKSRVGKIFRHVLKAAGLPRFRLYDLKHTYASLRIAGNAPVTYVATQLGHTTPATTLRYYAKWVPTGNREWVEKDD